MGDAKLYDNHGREINYLRLAVTDRCNLRCFYCMPEEGIKYVPKDQLLSFEEMHRIIRLTAEMGINKIRITGGEPFVRKRMMDFIEDVAKIDGIDTVHLTTNGTLTEQYIPRLVDAGIKSVNLSLDSLRKDRFFEITRRDQFDEVVKTLDAMLETDLDVKINAVVMGERNADDILSFVELTRNKRVAVRFIEEMPFNGSGARDDLGYWNHVRILNHIRSEYPDLIKLQDPPSSTSSNYRIEDFKGQFGIIAAYSRTFCGSCNRLRVTPQGLLKTCLYDSGVFNVRDILRANATDQQVKDAFLDAIGNRAKDGWEAERKLRDLPVTESMSTIGG